MGGRKEEYEEEQKIDWDGREMRRREEYSIV